MNNESGATMLEVFEHVFGEAPESDRETNIVPFPSRPLEGQIVAVQPEKGRRSVAVVLNQCLENEDGETIDQSLWSGWIASPYIAYASHWDVILTDEEENSDFKLVHAWNLINIHVGQHRVLNRLEEDDLKKIRSVFHDYLTDYRPKEFSEGTYTYGQKCERQTVDGVEVVTGPPLGSYAQAVEHGDPRVEFREVYNALADELQDVALEYLREKKPSEDEGQTADPWPGYQAAAESIPTTPQTDAGGETGNTFTPKGTLRTDEEEEIHFYVDDSKVYIHIRNREKPQKITFTAREAAFPLSETEFSDTYVIEGMPDTAIEGFIEDSKPNKVTL